MTNVVALKPQSVEPTELERIAERINDRFSSAEKNEARADERDRLAQKQKWEATKARGRAVRNRTQAGFDLFEAKAALEAERPGASFEAWLTANIKRQPRDCYKCMALARDYEEHRCLGVALGRPQAIWDGRVVEADDDGNLQSVPAVQINPEQRPRAVKMIIGLFRKLPREWRDWVQRELEAINANDRGRVKERRRSEGPDPARRLPAERP